jgi:hypothetical protein
MFGATEAERILAGLFVERFNDDGKLLAEFLLKLEQIKLPFDLRDQLRRRDYLGYPSFECGLPSTYHYFVPDSGWGSERPPPVDPLQRDFVYSTDGAGLNFGCPIKLKRAIELLFRLKTSDQEECIRNLASPQQHLSTVEELLWLDVWDRAIQITRSEGTPSRTHDWIIHFDGFKLRLECKFRPFDWARFVDGPAFEPAGDFLAGKASKQLPDPPESSSLNAVAVTGIAPVDDQFRRLCSYELQTYSNVQVLIYQTLPGDMTVFSLDASLATAVQALILSQPADRYQPGYSIFHNRAERTRREKARSRQPASPKQAGKPAALVEMHVASLPPRRVYLLPPLPYRAEISSRLPITNEPIFRSVTPY